MQAFGMLPVDESAIIRGLFDLLGIAKERRHLFTQDIQEWIEDPCIYQNVVRGNTGLPAVEKFGSDDLSSRIFQVGIRTNDRRTLSAEFQGYGCV